MDSSEFDVILQRLADNDSSLTETNLGYRGPLLQNDEDARRLASALTTNTTLRELHTFHANIGPDGLAALVDAIQECTSIEYVTFCDCRIGDEGAKSFAAVLADKNCSLKKLALGYNNIGHVGLRFLAAALADNTSLQFLNLCYNSIGNGEGAEAINKILVSSRSLQSLNLWGNPAVSSSNTKHHNKIMNGIRQRCRQTPNTLPTVRVDNRRLQHQIDNYVEWSHLGRRLLSTESNETAPVAFWVHYIAKISSESNLVYDLVQAKPDLFKRNVQTGQKRPPPIQNSAEETVEPADQPDEHCSKRRHLG